MKQSEYIAIFDKNSEQYQKLQAFADLLNDQGTAIEYEVETTWFDFHQNWKWTTIIAHDTEKPASSILASWQMLTPTDQKTILENNPDSDAVKKLAEKIIENYMRNR